MGGRTREGVIKTPHSNKSKKYYGGTFSVRPEWNWAMSDSMKFGKRTVINGSRY